MPYWAPASPGFETLDLRRLSRLSAPFGTAAQLDFEPVDTTD